MIEDMSRVVDALTPAQRKALIEIGNGARFFRIRGGWRATGQSALRMKTVDTLLNNRLVMVSTETRHPSLKMTGNGRVAYYEAKERIRKR